MCKCQMQWGVLALQAMGTTCEAHFGGNDESDIITFTLKLR